MYSHASPFCYTIQNFLSKKSLPVILKRYVLNLKSKFENIRSGSYLSTISDHGDLTQ